MRTMWSSPVTRNVMTPAYALGGRSRIVATVAGMRRAVCRSALLALVVAALLPATGALAHDPIVLADSQTTPDLGPLLPDGTISFALYGLLNSPGDSRGFRV